MALTFLYLEGIIEPVPRKTISGLHPYLIIFLTFSGSVFSFSNFALLFIIKLILFSPYLLGEHFLEMMVLFRQGNIKHYQI